jgi:glycosyltransferase involved in cell wall biosynthesis
LFTAFAERGHLVAAAFVADRRGQYSIPLPAVIQPIPIPGWWWVNLGQATLASIARYISCENLRRKWDCIQQAISWRTIRWHRARFQRRIELEFARRWNEFDVLYVHGNAILASEVARYRPTVLRLPGPVEPEFASILRSVHAVCANGDALVQIRKFLGDHAIELPLGVDRQKFTPGPTTVRRAIGWTERHQVIGYVGRLTHLKGVDLLAAAFRQISRDIADVRLLIIGSGAEEKNIRPILAHELTQKLVHIEPDVDHSQLAQWYRAMDVLVMPSRYENFSNAVVEAMACGVPFIGSDIGGNRILAKTGAGWLFESESESSLALRLREILSNWSESKARGIVAIDYVRNYCSWSVIAERLEQIIESRLGVR